jgi:hypothetical protein
MTAWREAELRVVPDHRCTPCDEVAGQSRKELAEDLRPPGHQQMGMPALGNALPVRRHLREQVAFYHRHSLVCIGQHPGGEESGQAGPEDHYVVADLFHPTPPAS